MSETPTGTDRVELTARCGYTVTNIDGNEEPCDLPATGHRWYQDVGEHEDLLDVACDNHRNEGGRLIASLRADLQALTAERDDARFFAEKFKAALHNATDRDREHMEKIAAERDAARAELAAANARCAELERRVESDMKIRLEVEKVLDLALGSEPVDGAGEGLASDVHLLAIRWSEALDRADALQATLDRVTALPDEWEAAEVGVSSPDTALSGNECAADLRAALTPEGTP